MARHNLARFPSGTISYSNMLPVCQSHCPTSMKTSVCMLMVSTRSRIPVSFSPMEELKGILQGNTNVSSFAKDVPDSRRHNELLL